MRVKRPIPTMLHPITGLPLEPQFFLGKRGNVVTVPVVMGGAPDGDEGGSGAQSGGATGSGGAGTGTGTGTGGTGELGTGAQSGDGTEETGESVSRKDFEDLKRQLQTADQKRTEAEKKIQDAERAKLDETERAKLELTEAQQVISKLEQEIQSLRTEKAWLSHDAVQWHDGEAALTLARNNGVFEGLISEDGKVDATKLKAAIDKFSKSHPYMVKGEAKQGQQQPNTVTSVGSKGTKETGPDDAVLKERYRSLNR